MESTPHVLQHATEQRRAALTPQGGQQVPGCCSGPTKYGCGPIHDRVLRTILYYIILEYSYNIRPRVHETDLPRRYILIGCAFSVAEE